MEISPTEKKLSVVFKITILLFVVLYVSYSIYLGTDCGPTPFNGYTNTCPASEILLVALVLFWPGFLVFSAILSFFILARLFIQRKIWQGSILALVILGFITYWLVVFR